MFIKEIDVIFFRVEDVLVSCGMVVDVVETPFLKGLPIVDFHRIKLEKFSEIPKPDKGGIGKLTIREVNPGLPIFLQASSLVIPPLVRFPSPGEEGIGKLTIIYLPTTSLHFQKPLPKEKPDHFSHPDSTPNSRGKMTVLCAAW